MDDKNNINYKNETVKFFSEDSTQAFVMIFICFTILLAFGMLDINSYTNLMKWGIIGFFGKELTNFHGLK